jgi:hypothetical protein
MFSKCRFSANSSSVRFWISSNNSCGISVSRKDVKVGVVNYAVDVAMNCTLLCVGVVCGVDVFVSSSVFGL